MVRVAPTLPPSLVPPPMPHQASGFATPIIPYGTSAPMISWSRGPTRLNESGRQPGRVGVRETLASAAIGVTAAVAENSWSSVKHEQIKGRPASAPPTVSLSSSKRPKLPIYNYLLLHYHQTTTLQNLIKMKGGCGNAGCTCADCGCAQGACSCGKCTCFFVYLRFFFVQILFILSFCVCTAKLELGILIVIV